MLSFNYVNGSYIDGAVRDFECGFAGMGVGSGFHFDNFHIT